MTTDEVREFQRAHRDWLGMVLRVDGDVGPRTRWALAISRLDPRRQAIVANACGYVGMHERSPNRGPDIDGWLGRCGVPLGQPWCAAFASWCISVPGLPTVREASAQRLGKGLWKTTRPVPGDVMWFPTGSWQGHCGIVIGTNADFVATVEGNRDNAVRLQCRARTEVFFGDVLGRDEVAGDAPIPSNLQYVPVRAEGTR